ncbi:MAG: DUF4342 domain-containing protein [Chloroflexota bacterium]
MAKKKAKAEEPEVIEITEEDVAAEKSEGRSWTEEFEMAGGEVKNFLKTVWTEGNVRRVIVRNEKGDTVVNIPVAVGALGIIPPLTGPVLAVTVVGTVVALATKCKITLERHEPAEKEVAA